MAHFAQLDSNNIVIDVLVVDNADILDDNGDESEAIGVQFLRNLLGQSTNWKQTSYNGSFRKRFAGIGYEYRATEDFFIMPQPHSSWTLNTTTGEWEPPIVYPDDGLDYYWDETTQAWVEFDPTASE